MVNVIVLFAKIEEAKSIKNLLVRHGINVTQVCTTGAQAAQADMDLLLDPGNEALLLFLLLLHLGYEPVGFCFLLTMQYL